MKPLHALLALTLVLGSQACSDATQPSDVDDGADLHRGRGGIGVLSQNLYVGADVDAVITALATPDPEDDIPALMAAIGTIQHTDFPARARAIAKKIRRQRPAFVGFQEVSTIDVDIPPLGVSLHLNFQDILLQALAAEGLNYQVGARHDNFTAAPAPGISLVDAELILVDASRVTVLSSSGHTFQANLGVVAPGVELLRGWVQVEAEVGGRTYTFASTHTEGTGPDDLLLGLHAMQVGELAAYLGDASPAIVVGDFNTPPGTPAYQAMVDAGFTDVWKALRPRPDGFTCCQAPDLSNQVSILHERIDYVWARGFGGEQGHHSLQGQVSLYGNTPSERLLNGAGESIWPADHAGLLANLMQGHLAFR